MIVNGLPWRGFRKRGSNKVKKKLISWIASAALVIAPVSAAMADTSNATPPKQPVATQTTGPLSPGKAAGVKQAQGVDAGDLLIITAIAGALAVGVWALTKDNGNHHHTSTTGTN